MKTFSYIILCLSFFAFGLFVGVMLYALNILPFEPYNTIYELPNGGYIFEDDYPFEYGGVAIRYNHDSFNGTLDYQITLNPYNISK